MRLSFWALTEGIASLISQKFCGEPDQLLVDPAAIGYPATMLRVEEVLFKAGATGRFFDRLVNRPEYASFRCSPYLPDVNLAQWSTASPDSLGHRLYQKEMQLLTLTDNIPRFLLHEQGYKPGMPISEPGFLLLKRFYLSHDAWHELLGFSSATLGEMGIKAFELVQTGHPISLLLLLLIFINTACRYPENLGRMLEDFRTGLKLAMDAPPLLLFRWEDCLDLPVEECRRQFFSGNWHAPVAIAGPSRA